MSQKGSLDFAAAREAVARHARVTPLLYDHALSGQWGRDVWLKAECLQATGSFKVRGAAARLEALSASQRRRGIVACSSGNHGRAVAYVAGRLGIPATIYVPEWVDPVKLAGIVAAGADAVREGATFDESEALALAAARAEGRSYVSAYDDPWVIAGQGTVAEECLGQLRAGVGQPRARVGQPRADDAGRGPGGTVSTPAAFVVPLSGGGLVGGMAAALAEGAAAEASIGSPPLCLAASAENAAVMLASLRAGRPVELPEEDTLANALAGGIGLDNAYSFDLVRRRVTDHATVTESQIADAMRYAARHLRLVVEGGGAVALASVMAGAWRDIDLPDGPVVIVLSGGNVSRETLARVLEG